MPGVVFDVGRSLFGGIVGSIVTGEESTVAGIDAENIRVSTDSSGPFLDEGVAVGVTGAFDPKGDGEVFVISKVDRVGVGEGSGIVSAVKFYATAELAIAAVVPGGGGVDGSAGAGGGLGDGGTDGEGAGGDVAHGIIDGSAGTFVEFPVGHGCATVVVVGDLGGGANRIVVFDLVDFTIEGFRSTSIVSANYEGGGVRAHCAGIGINLNSIFVETNGGAVKSHGPMTPDSSGDSRGGRISCASTIDSRVDRTVVVANEEAIVGRGAGEFANYGVVGTVGDISVGPRFDSERSGVGGDSGGGDAVGSVEVYNGF